MNKLLLLLPLLYFSCKQAEKTNVQKMDDYLQAQAKLFKFNGNVLVASKGKIILQKSYGFADYNSQSLLNDSSLFELASVSKQFTAMGILLLKQKGKLSLSDSLRGFFPELPYTGITIRHLLTHTSGLPDYFWLMVEKWDRSRIATNNDMIALLASEKPPALFAPGKKWEYSNTAYVILASIIEKTSGQSFSKYLDSAIFRPLGMHQSRTYNTRRSQKEIIPNYAYGYEYSDSAKRYLLPDSIPDLSFVIYMDGMQGDGIVNSTTGDLLKWDRALKNNTLLPLELQNEMLTGKELMDTANKTYYGYGVMAGKDEQGNFIAHSGGWPGYGTYLKRNVDEDNTFIVLSNNSSRSSAISGALEQLLVGKPVVLPYEHKSTRLDSVSIEKFTGSFKGNSTFSIKRNGDTLFRVNTNGGKLALIPESATKFYYSDGSDRQIEFELGDDNTVKKAWLIFYGVKIEFVKQ